MITSYDSPDDMPPEMAAYCEHLRLRAQAQGCICRPEVTIDLAKRITVVEHAEECPACSHPSVTPSQN